jgi:phosphatidate cytidylyltransferase
MLMIRSKDNETSSLSKSARKRLARQTAKAAAAPPILSPGNKDEAMTALTGKIKANGSSLQNSVNSEDIKETAEKTKENVQENVQKGKETAKENLQKGKDIAEENVEKGKQIAEENVQKGKEIAEETTETAKKTAKETMETAKSTAANVKEKVESKAAEAGKAVQENIPESISSTVEAAADKLSSSVSSSESPSPSPATKPVEIKAKNKERSSSPPASSSFSPSLPSSLPSASAKQLPANRKRKQPQDFTPSGPGTPSATPASPKNGVKFSDGVAPGEGPEGEKIIPVKKNQNVIERTVWTFIMIFGFIGLLCAGHPYMILLVMLCQALVYSEVTALFNLRDRKSTIGDIADDRWSTSCWTRR